MVYNIGVFNKGGKINVIETMVPKSFRNNYENQ